MIFSFLDLMTGPAISHTKGWRRQTQGKIKMPVLQSCRTAKYQIALLSTVYIKRIHDLDEAVKPQDS